MFLCYFPLQLYPSVLWYCWLGLLTCKNRLPYNLYCVGGDVKHCSINHLRKIYIFNYEYESYITSPSVKLGERELLVCWWSVANGLLCWYTSLCCRHSLSLVNLSLCLFCRLSSVTITWTIPLRLCLSSLPLCVLDEEVVSAHCWTTSMMFPLFVQSYSLYWIVYTDMIMFLYIVRHGLMYST